MCSSELVAACMSGRAACLHGLSVLGRVTGAVLMSLHTARLHPCICASSAHLALQFSVTSVRLPAVGACEVYAAALQTLHKAASPMLRSQVTQTFLVQR